MKSDHTPLIQTVVAAVSLLLAFTGLAQTGSYDTNTAACIAPNSFVGGEDPYNLQAAVVGTWRLHVLQADNPVAGDTGMDTRTWIGISQDGPYAKGLTVDGRQSTLSGREIGSRADSRGAAACRRISRLCVGKR